MTLRLVATLLIGTLGAATFVACGDDAEPGEKADGSGGQTSGPPPAYDCSAHKWMNVSDECWSCLCDTCKPQLDACNEDCTDIFECAHEKGTLVDNLPEIGCEIRATLVECIATKERQDVANQLIQFDSCLIGAGAKPPFRACDAECATPYPGNVCDRFPEPMPAQ